ncbi:FecR domain-containing protein [Limnohabitans sp. Hippo4]|uniref:FecR family protein n=1 Tax=Limnohabitans sp. Hippo4 TaxID=1826167 RepID=UPI0011B1FF51|nr:FecR family protein [Limnohabitans sp. Hippo4]
MSIQVSTQPHGSAVRLLKRGVVGTLLGFVLMCLTSVAIATQVVGEVTLTIGKSKIERSTQEAEPQKGGSVQEGDVIRTSDNGHVHIRFIDGARVSVRPNSVFRIHEFKYSPADPASSVVRLSLDSGEARSISGAAAQAAKDRFRLNTPLVAIGVKGTDFVTQVAKDVIRVTVNQGAIVMAPFDSACKAESLGVCTTSRAKELTAEMLGQALVYRLGSADPSLQNIGKSGQSDASRVLQLDRQSREGAERPLASETESKNPLNAVAATKLIWGRWGGAIPGDNLTIPFLEAFKGNEVTVGDGYYFLFREPSKLNVLPTLTTKVDFGLKNSSAYYRNAANEMQPASVQSGTLGVDFASKTFTTNLNLTAQGTGVQSFSQSGTLNPGTGIFLSNGSTAAGSVAGAVTLDARQAGFLFRAPIGAGTFSGATLWGR